ncbi:MAG: CoA ester lyase, partial [Gammaproteobacteria bacterium]
KIAIHPDQVAIINEAFTPSAAEVSFAQAVIAAFVANPDAGTLSLDGKMLDKPHLKQAERVMAIANRAQRR